ncbi:SURF1 family cytochrome oxidase biogenesis protein [Timonella sp. A28]|uniref:SURF1 family cytochrome oxidase biogenesis protein n=1 Tax=Timonella sp. A28 TaxID=3442640 RepID=UPI003EB7E325
MPQHSHTSNSSQEREESAHQFSLVQWIGIAVAVGVLVALCIAAGRWQWHRHVDRADFISTVDANYESIPVDIAEILPNTHTQLAPSRVWSQAQLRGTYLPEYTVLLRNRPVNSSPALHVLVPFETQSGNIFLINRGWISNARNAAGPESIPAPPAGLVDVVVHLRADEPATDRSAPIGQVQAINIKQVLQAGSNAAESAESLLQRDYYQYAYGALSDEKPSAQQSLRALPKPDTDPRSHLSYAFQWWVFAIGGAATFLVLFVKDRTRFSQKKSSGNPFAALNEAEEAVSSDSKTSKRRAQRTTEEDYEDALFDE